MPDSVRGPYTEQFHPPYRTGIVAQIESVPPYRVRVQFPDQANVLSWWLPVQVMKTMNDKDFWQPDLGEQVSVVMDEWDENGIVTGSVPSQVDSAPSGLTPSDFYIQFADGTIIQYNRVTSTLKVSICPAGTATIQTADNLSSVTVGDDSVTVDSSDVGLTAEIGEIDLTGEVYTDQNLHVGSGATGTFSTSTGQTVTVQDGIIIDIE